MVGDILSAAIWATDIYGVASAVNQTDFLMSPFDFAIENRALPAVVSCDASVVANYAMASNSTTTEVFLPLCADVGVGAFEYCRSLVSARLPSCESLGDAAFYACQRLTSVDLGSCSVVGNNAFCLCRNLSAIALPNCAEIGSYAFQFCSSLALVDLTGVSGVPSLGSSALAGTAAVNSGRIRVPASLYSAFRSAPMWSQYSSRITSEVS